MSGDLTLTPSVPYLWSGISLNLLPPLQIPGMSCDTAAQRHTVSPGKALEVNSLIKSSHDGWVASLSWNPQTWWQGTLNDLWPGFLSGACPLPPKKIW